MVGITAPRVEYSELFFTQIVPRRGLVIPHEMGVTPKGTAPCTISAACAALAQIGDSLEKFLLSAEYIMIIIPYTNQ